MPEFPSFNPSHTLFERHAPEVVDAVIKQVMAMRKEGTPEPEIMQEVFTDWSDEDASITWDMALARIQDLKEPRVILPLFFTQKDLRFATHRFIAVHRAKRLSCDMLVEIGCGIGSQTIEFAKTCKKVIAIDTDARKVSFAKSNCQLNKISNVEFIVGDGIEALESLHGYSAVFCDPERAPQATERSIFSLTPSIVEILEQSAHSAKIVGIELPPQIKEVPINGELEYASIDGKLARLTLYRTSAQSPTRSAVVLPSGETLCDTDPTISSQGPALSADKFLFEIDEAIAAAKLIDRVPVPGLKDLPDSKPCLKTGSIDHPSPFFRARYRTIAAVQEKTQINQALREHNAAKAIIRFSIDPKFYWNERKALEHGLEGTRHFHVFNVLSRFVIAEKIGVIPKPAQTTVLKSKPPQIPAAKSKQDHIQTTRPKPSKNPNAKPNQSKGSSSLSRPSNKK